MSDFEREMLINVHTHGAVEAGRRAAFALLKRGGQWEVDDESDETAYQMAQQISAAVVEVVRSSVYREAAADLYEMSEYGFSDILKAKADELDRQYQRRHPCALSDQVLDELKANYLKLETDHRYVFRERGEQS